MGKSNDAPGHLLAVASNVVSLAHVRRIEEALESAGIEVVRLKGSGYLGTLYPTFDRRMVDVDLLVRPVERPRARRVLQQCGYAVVPPPRHWRYSWHQHYNWQFVGDGVRPMLELHQALCAAGLFDIDSDGLVDRRVRRSDGVSEMYTLCPEDALLHLGVHLVKDGYQHDERLPADAARMIEQWRPDWDVVVERAHRWRVTAGLRYVLEEARGAGAEVPESALEGLGSPGRGAAIRAIVGELGPLRSRALRFTKLAVLALEPRGGRNLARFASRYALRRSVDGLYALGPDRFE
ncbi:MAG: hypothetical protein DRJ42_21130 [Deltaproteobacteria bacterium]|nr:MAG: hypothetical protein DRJ42_21130 [Deltaproteobacteria bacterium]